MANQESTTRTLLVALVVCLVSSVFVAGAAVALKPKVHVFTHDGSSRLLSMSASADLLK